MRRGIRRAAMTTVKFLDTLSIVLILRRNSKENFHKGHIPKILPKFTSVPLCFKFHLTSFLSGYLCFSIVFFDIQINQYPLAHSNSNLPASHNSSGSFESIPALFQSRIPIPIPIPISQDVWLHLRRPPGYVISSPSPPSHPSSPPSPS